MGLGYVAWNAQRLLTEQFVSTIESEIDSLSNLYRYGGLRRLVTSVERRSRAPGALLYLVTTETGERVGPDVRVPSELLWAGRIEEAVEIYREIAKRTPESPVVAERRLDGRICAHA